MQQSVLKQIYLFSFIFNSEKMHLLWMLKKASFNQNKLNFTTLNAKPKLDFSSKSRMFLTFFLLTFKCRKWLSVK